MMDRDLLPVLQLPTVLVVDDDPSVLEALTSLLSPRLEPMFRVEAAESGEEALELIQARGHEVRPVALVISDEKMPGMAGNDLLIALRQHELHRHGGRILITGYAGLESAKRAINEAEVDRYFPKPWDTEGELLPAIREILERFLKGAGLNVFHQSRVLAAGSDPSPVLEVRREWQSYLDLFGQDPEAPLPELDKYEVEGDREATHILIHRVEPENTRPSAAIRLMPANEENSFMLDQLAFRPEDSGDQTERHLLRAAILTARGQDCTRLLVSAPILRKDVYADVGFEEDDSQQALNEEAKGEITLVCQPGQIESKWSGDGEPSFLKRWDSDQTLCRCDQTACTEYDYAGTTRDYYCPLDVTEGRGPESYLLGNATRD